MLIPEITQHSLSIVIAASWAANNAPDQQFGKSFCQEALQKH